MYPFEGTMPPNRDLCLLFCFYSLPSAYTYLPNLSTFFLLTLKFCLLPMSSLSRLMHPLFRCLDIFSKWLTQCEIPDHNPYFCIIWYQVHLSSCSDWSPGNILSFTLFSIIFKIASPPVDTPIQKSQLSSLLHVVLSYFPCRTRLLSLNK